MWTISQIVIMAVMAGLSVVDMYSHRIPVSVLIWGSLAVLGYQVFIGKGSIWLISGGIGVGILFLSISKATGEGIGYGDSWAILILGIYLGVWKLIEVLFTAFLILEAAAVGCLAAKKMSRKYRLPFIPFLTLGYLCSIFTKGIGG